MSSSSTRGTDKHRVSAARDPLAVDDMRIGRVARVLRQRLGLRQEDVARSASCSQDEVSLLERGRIEGMSLRRMRRLFRVFDADVVVLIRWRGGSLDHLLDARHASLADATIGLLAGAGWVVQPEVSYSVYGERGSIDLLAWHEPTRTLLVIELKTELTSIEETLRRHDTKIRLGPGSRENGSDGTRRLSRDCSCSRMAGRRGDVWIGIRRRSGACIRSRPRL